MSVFKNTKLKVVVTFVETNVTLCPPQCWFTYLPICKNETLHIGEREKNYTQEKSDTLVEMVWHEKSSVFFILTLITIVEKKYLNFILLTLDNPV